MNSPIFAICALIAACLLSWLLCWRIRKIILGAEQRLLDSHRTHFARVARVEELISIYSTLRPRAPLLTMGGMAISPDFGNLLLSLISELKPRVVLEAGSGVSTLLTGYCLEQLDAQDENGELVPSDPPSRQFTQQDRDREYENRNRRHTRSWYQRQLVGIVEGTVTMSTEQQEALLALERSKARTGHRKKHTGTPTGIRREGPPSSCRVPEFGVWAIVPNRATCRINNLRSINTGCRIDSDPRLHCFPSS